MDRQETNQPARRALGGSSSLAFGHGSASRSICGNNRHDLNPREPLGQQFAVSKVQKTGVDQFPQGSNPMAQISSLVFLENGISHGEHWHQRRSSVSHRFGMKSVSRGYRERSIDASSSR